MGDVETLMEPQPRRLSEQERTQIVEIAASTRAILEGLVDLSGYRAGLSGSKVSGACLYASILVQISLEKFASCRAQIRGGSGESSMGIRCDDGVWRGHYWVEGLSKSGAHFLCDITADQFGLEQVVVWDASRSWDRYRSEAPDLVDRDVAAALREMAGERRLAEKGKTNGD